MRHFHQLFLRALLGLALAISFLEPITFAQDWSQWRGPSRDGVVPVTKDTIRWPSSFSEVWRIRTGEGYSSPVIAGQRLFLHSRIDPDELVQAFDLATGNLLWERRYAAPFEKNQYARGMDKGPFATPLIRDSRLFTLGASAILTAWDCETGEQRWQQDFSATVSTSNKFCGTSSSPLWSGGLLIAQVGSDVDGGQVLGLDPATGRSRWKWRGAGPGYTSPIEVKIGGKTQLITMTERSVVGLAADAGEELWSIPFPDEWHENIVAPLWTGSHLILSGTRQGTHGYTLNVTNGQWRAERVWRNATVAMYMSSPVFAEGVVYGHSIRQRGQFFAMDALTGATKWTSEGRQGDHASVLLTPSNVLFLTQGGDLVVVGRGALQFDEVRRYSLPVKKVYAAPAVLGSDFIVRDSEAVVRFGSKR